MAGMGTVLFHAGLYLQLINEGEEQIPLETPFIQAVRGSVGSAD